MLGGLISACLRQHCPIGAQRQDKTGLHVPAGRDRRRTTTWTDKERTNSSLWPDFGYYLLNRLKIHPYLGRRHHHLVPAVTHSCCRVPSSALINRRTELCICICKLQLAVRGSLLISSKSSLFPRACSWRSVSGQPIRSLGRAQTSFQVATGLCRSLPPQALRCNQATRTRER